MSDNSSPFSLFQIEHARSIAITAVLVAHDGGHDVAEFVAQVCTQAAEVLGGAEVLLAHRSGSWEASHVRALIEGTGI